MPQLPEPRRVFCEQVFVENSIDMFYLALRSGSELSVFAVGPDHAKQIYKLLGQKIDAYEMRYGRLEGRLPDEPMKSPIHPSDMEPPPTTL